MCDTKEELYEKIKSYYKNPLLWYFDYDQNNDILMYGDNEDPKITFVILYKSNISDLNIIDIGYIYKFGDYDGHRRYDFGYRYKIKEIIKLENNVYETLTKKIKKHFGYVFTKYEIIEGDIFDEETDICDGDSFIRINRNVIIYQLNNNIYFINEIEKNNLVNVCIDL